jgi:hypothetical protein
MTTPLLVQSPGRWKEASLKEYEGMTEKDLLDAWKNTTTFEDLGARDALVEVMKRKKLFPSEWTRDRETRAGLYPDILDPDFASRLYQKTEFADLKSGRLSNDVCDQKESGFDTTAVQRLVARFLHPLTPFRGLLLDHGVGVGKTCSAITVAESFLEMMPTNRVIILCPQAIRSGFLRTLFDPDRLTPLTQRDAQLRGEVWESKQCTGMTYLHLTGTATERDRSVVEKEVEAAIRKRYSIMGYLQFANMILKRLSSELPKTLGGEERRLAEDRILHDMFSDHLVIIDEAHNLRDIEGAAAADAALEVMSEESPVVEGGQDAAEGKKLTPILRRILRVSEGLRLMLMTATPMYNTAPEILFLLNLLVLNDGKDESQLLKPRDFFSSDGTLKPDAEDSLRTLCSRYISYMRGENPASFPLRLTPPESIGADLFKDYPTQSISKVEGVVKLSPYVKKILSMLPLVIHTPTKDSIVAKKLHEILVPSENAEKGREVTDFVLDQATQTANITYPDGSYGTRGWDSYFRVVPGRIRQYAWNAEGVIEGVFGMRELKHHAPKIAGIVESITKAEGLSFVFSRYVKAGALPIAAALECAGWTRVLGNGVSSPLLQDAPKVPRACAFCSHNESQDHHGHTFAPAHFVFLTGEDALTPDFKGTLRYANTLITDFEIGGGKVKAILGSQITSEGLDLKCIRECHLLDGWYHLNRIEQVIGRAVRYCSHAALPHERRNCLIYLHAVQIPEYETADLYAYRLAARKAISIGQVQRIIKVGAWDCLMNRDAILLKGLPKQRVVDARGRILPRYDPHDRPYTGICDFQESCEYVCTAVESGKADISTMKVEDARRRFIAKEAVLRRRFASDPALSLQDLRMIYRDIPWDIASLGIRSLLHNPRFVIERKDGIRGTLQLKHGYVVFHPLGVTDTDIPLSLRFGRAYGRLPRYMDLPRHALFAAERESLRPLPTEAVQEVVVKKVDVNVKEARKALQEWIDHVPRMLRTPLATDLKPPGNFSAGPFYEGWRWMFHHFASLPETPPIAHQWWMDNEWNQSEREVILRGWTQHGVPEGDESLVRGFQPVEFFKGSIAGYQIVDVAKNKVVPYCFFSGDAEPTICPSNLLEDVNHVVGPPIHYKRDTGPMYGFLAYNADDGRVIFKTVNKEEKSFRGAQCSQTPNLKEHKRRIRLVQDQIRANVSETHPIRALLLDDNPDTEPTKEELKLRKKTGKYAHVADMTLKQICPYMEFLFRWMDYHRIGGKRWFMSLVDSYRSNFQNWGKFD